MDEKERKEKSNKLFDKGMECYNNQQYKEALKCFEACIKFYQNDRAELFIGVCKNNIPEDTKSNNKTSHTNTNTNSNSYHRGYSYSKLSSSTASTSSSSSSNYAKNKSYSSDNIGGTSSEDQICKELLKKKDYYDILNIKKDATQAEIKKGYKKETPKLIKVSFIK